MRKLSLRLAQIFTGTEAEQKLVSMGLNPDSIRVAAIRGHIAGSNINQFDAKTASGTKRWLETLKHFRQLHCEVNPKQWVAESVEGLERLTNWENSITIITKSGDANTGNPDKSPKTKNPNGESVTKLINSNYEQLLLPGVINDLIANNNPNEITTYVNLYCHKKGKIYIEISKPVFLNKDGMAQEWIERIILDPIDVSEYQDSGKHNEWKGYTGNIVINITRK
ncbi:MAG: hypothetical protein QM523_07080 [Candidatus Pacebacteria bacterium]|nr:hypothetical protein [Candidatus Paceibacterota bacterium]